MNFRIAIAFVSFVLITSGALIAQPDSLSKADAQALIKSMCEKDQELRKALGAADRSDSIAYRDQQELVAQMDEMHNIMLHKVIEAHGFPGASEHGMVTTHEFWILIMHQDGDTELQESVLKWMKSMLHTGEVMGRDIAYLSDRVAVNKEECQMYGTQFHYDKVQDKNVPFEICDEKKLKKLRKRMGLMPFDNQVSRENQG